MTSKIFVFKIKRELYIKYGIYYKLISFPYDSSNGSQDFSQNIQEFSHLLLLKKIAKVFQIAYGILMTPDHQSISNIHHEIVTLDSPDFPERKFKSSVFRSQKKPPTRSCMLITGLSPRGPHDPRIIKLASLFAQAGYLVYVPFIEDYRELHIKQDTLIEISVPFDHLYRNSLQFDKASKPILFSISFGSLLALKLASQKNYADKIKHLYLFGAYGKWASMVDAIIFGDSFKGKRVNYDIRVMPVVFNNLIDMIARKSPEIKTSLIRESLKKYIDFSWEYDVSKGLSRLSQEAKKLSSELPTVERKLFLQGCGLQKDYQKMYSFYLKDLEMLHLEPLENKENILCSLSLLHSQNDTIISPNQFEILKRKLPQERLEHAFLLSSFSHSGKSGESFISLLKKYIKDIKSLFTFFWHIS